MSSTLKARSSPVVTEANHCVYVYSKKKKVLLFALRGRMRVVMCCYIVGTLCNNKIASAVRVYVQFTKSIH